MTRACSQEEFCEQALVQLAQTLLISCRALRREAALAGTDEIQEPRQQSRVGSEEPSLCDTCRCAKVCKLYDNDLMPTDECKSYILMPPSSVESAAATAAGRVLAGLCVNCSQRFTCTYERPEGGVWHCEDYS
jgi:hypothetical protein